MYRSRVVRCLALLAALGLAACAAYQAQHSGGSAGGGAESMAPAEAPAREFTELPTGTQLARVRGEIEETRKRLASEGKYSCCVEPPCNECLLKYGECHCREAVRKEGPCCGECTEAWVEGRGAVEGISAWELLERKKQQIREKESGGGQEGHQHHH